MGGQLVQGLADHDGCIHIGDQQPLTPTLDRLDGEIDPTIAEDRNQL